MKKLCSYEWHYRRELEEFSFEQFLEIFSGLSHANFVNEKSVLKSYIEWCCKKGYASRDKLNELESINYRSFDTDSFFTKEYFKDFQMLDFCVSRTVQEADVIDPDQFDTVSIIIYLTWFLVSKEDMVTIKKSDVLLADNMIYLQSQQKYVVLPESVMKKISLYAKSNGYYQRAKSNIFRKYKDSEYLLRSYKSSQISPKNIPATLNVFSEKSSKYIFQYERIRKSAIFSHIVELENQGVKINLLDVNTQAQLLLSTSMDKKGVDFVFEEYKKFKQCYYPEMK